jgi:hypothetical protein
MSVTGRQAGIQAESGRMAVRPAGVTAETGRQELRETDREVERHAWTGRHAGWNEEASRQAETGMQGVRYELTVRQAETGKLAGIEYEADKQADRRACRVCEAGRQAGRLGCRLAGEQKGI